MDRDYYKQRFTKTRYPTGIGATSRGSIVSIQRKVRVSWDGEGVNSKGIQEFGCFDLRRGSALTADLRKTVRDEEDKDDQGAVGRALDLEIPEQRVGTE